MATGLEGMEASCFVKGNTMHRSMDDLATITLIIMCALVFAAPLAILSTLFF